MGKFVKLIPRSLAAVLMRSLVRSSSRGIPASTSMEGGGVEICTEATAWVKLAKPGDDWPNRVRARPGCNGVLAEAGGTHRRVGLEGAWAAGNDGEIIA